MKKILIALIALTGCTSFDTLQSEVANKGAAVADELRDTSEFMLCRGITVGAWVRRYGANPKLADAWRTLCGTNIVMETPAATVAPGKPAP